MKLSYLAVPLVLLTSACSTHYSVSGHSSHQRHVSVGVHGHGHGDGAEILGALIVGGLIGHALSESAESNERESVNGESKESVEELVDGYPIENSSNVNDVAIERNPEQNRYYQVGQDGKCYLMEKKGNGAEVISAVPSYSCQ